jgi:hypothetical protein
MSRRLTIAAIVCMFLMLLFADGAQAASKADKKSDAGWKRHIAENNRLGFDEDLLQSSAPMAKYPAYAGKGPEVTCDDIDPQMGSSYIITHEQIGHTWYDFQKNAAMARMISVTTTGYRHFSWMFTDGPYGGSHYRYVDANCKNPAGSYVGQVHVDGGQYKNAGYSCQTHFSDGKSLVAYHRAAGQAGDPVTNSMLATEDALCSGQFSRHWDIPDSILNEPSGQNGSWPKVEIKHDGETGRDYIHVVMTESNLAGGAPVMVAYERCYLDADPNYLICQAYVNGATQTYTLNRNTNYSNPSRLVAHFDTSCGITPVPVVSPVSQRVAVAYLKSACDGSCSYLSDACYIESMVNGDDWIDGTNYPPPEFNITNYGCGYPEEERAYHDLNACYDYNDSLHIVFLTVGFPEPEYLQPGIARLYHWSKVTGKGLITSAIWGGTDAGAHNANIAKMSISAKDPVYHPGGEPDSVYLFCIWTQFDTNTSVGGVQDNSDAAFTNGELYGVGSNDGGLTWGNVWDLTQTRTPGCTPGNCVSEHWSSLAQNMYNGDLHIQYVCDKHPGSALGGDDVGSMWADNPMYYLRLGEWEVGARCEGHYTMSSPHSFWRPAVKVAPGGSRVLTLNIANVGNLPMPYVAVASDPDGCISGAYSDVLPITQNVDLTFVVSGAYGSCDSTFISGTVTLTMCDVTTPIPVHAVTAKDYYECPVDPETFDTVQTSALRLYANANSLEWISDISTWPDTVHDVFFQGGSFVATAIDGNKAVGRWYGENDWRAGVRDKLYYSQCTEGDTLCHLLFTKNIFLHAPPNPPYVYHCYWYWWEWSKMIKVCELPDNEKIVIKYIRVQRHDPPVWWPTADPPQGAYSGHEDTYIGMMMDIDCPYDTMGSENARNWGGYDAVNEIAWQRGYDYTGAHPAYNNYYAGMALADPGSTNPVTPYGAHVIKNNYYLYPQSPWGWDDEQFYDLAATAGTSVQDGDSLLDRSVVITAQHIPAGNTPHADYSFVVVEAMTDGGLTDLQSLVAQARQIVRKERVAYGFPVLCGDGTGDQAVNLSDALRTLNYLFKGDKPPLCPLNRADVNSDGTVNLSDALVILNYLFKGDKAPKCPGIFFLNQ